MYGQGILKGLGVTIRHFFETYAADLRAAGRKVTGRTDFETRQGLDAFGIYTVQYPDEKIAVPERFRFIPFLVVEDDDHPDRPGHDWCTSCGICAKVCPPQCIWIVRSEDPVTKRPVPEPQAFFIDTDICMNCGFCAEFCPFDAIKMDHDYELADYDRTQTHIFDKEKLSKPFSYWRHIAPTTAWEEAVARGGWEHPDVIKDKKKQGQTVPQPGPTWDAPYVPPVAPKREEPPVPAPVAEGVVAAANEAAADASSANATAARAEMTTETAAAPAANADADAAAREERRLKREAALAKKHAREGNPE